MSQKLSRKSCMNEEKEKRQTDSPAKDVKKKMATDKEKQAIDKTDKPEKQTEKPEKQTDKKQGEKSEKQPDKSTEKIMDKKEKTEKKDTQGEKSKDDGAKEEKVVKNDLQDEKERPQQNGTAIVQNGVADVTNGTASEPNGTVSGDSDDDDVTLVIDDEPEQDEMFPELTYDDTSDTEGFELPATDSAPSRSLTRRSQPKDSKVLKLKEDAPASDRKLRSSDSPKPQEVRKSQEPTKKLDKTHEPVTEKESSEKEHEESEPELRKEQDNSELEVKDQTAVTQTKELVVKVIEIIEEDKKDEEDVAEKIAEDLVEVEVVVEVEPDVEEENEEPRKLDTNYSKSRVKVSPYRRSNRIADQTASSMLANYTGNNTTMEMDITETSFMSEREEGSPPPEDSSYLRGLRTIRARNSYKKLAHLALLNPANRSARSLGNMPGIEHRPTAPVVGRKRRPDADRELSDTHHQPTAGTATGHRTGGTVGCKRMRLLERIAHPFRRNLPHALPINASDIVGINTDLPLTAPVASADTFDPETLKAAPLSPHIITPPAPAEPLATPLDAHHTDNKRCIIV